MQTCTLPRHVYSNNSKLFTPFGGDRVENNQRYMRQFELNLKIVLGIDSAKGAMALKEKEEMVVKYKKLLRLD